MDRPEAYKESNGHMFSLVTGPFKEAHQPQVKIEIIKMRERKMLSPKEAEPHLRFSNFTLLNVYKQMICDQFSNSMEIKDLILAF